MNVRLRVLTFSLVTVCLISNYSFGQSEKISLRMRPSPNQTVRMKMVQEIDLTVTIDGLPANAAAALPPGPMNITSTNTTIMTEKVGAVDPQGNLEVEMTIDEIHGESAMNGRSMPAGQPAPGFIGKTFIIVYDQHGAILSTKMPPAAGLPENTVKQFVESLMHTMPDNLLAVGESATSPLSVAVPIPVPGAAPMTLEGDTKYTLVSIDKQDVGRVGTFDVNVDAKLNSVMDIPSPNGSAKVDVNFKMNGGGRTLNNLERGVIKSSQTTSTLDGMVRMSGQAANLNMTLQGTIKATITTEQ